MQTNVIVTRNNALLSVTFRQEAHTSKHQNEPRMDVIEVNTVSPYGPIWDQCEAQFNSQQIDYTTIHPTSYQYCYCHHKEEKDYKWLSWLSWF